MRLLSPGVVRDDGSIACAGRAAADGVGDDARVTERWLLPPQPDGGGAVGPCFYAAGGQRGEVVQRPRCNKHTYVYNNILQRSKPAISLQSSTGPNP